MTNSKTKRILTSILISVLVIAVIGCIVYRIVNKTPESKLTAQQKMLSIVKDGGCIDCHTANPTLPFYGSLPGVKDLIDKHVKDGYKSFDISQMISSLEKGEKINEIDLAKVEKSIIDDRMPMAQYYLIHWGSSITNGKREIMLNAIRQLRMKFYPNTLSSEKFTNETIRPLPDAVQVNPQKAELGELLYHDVRLSADNTVSCASCHDLATAGVDNQAVSDGIGGHTGSINAPTVYNSGFNFVQFWDGRAATLAQQAAGPPLNPVEMGCSSFNEIIAKLSSDKNISSKFKAIYKEGITENSITDAIGEFEKTLVTPNCRFDKYLKGDNHAMTRDEINGYEMFKKYNCATCHAGELMGGQSYELMGERANYFKDRKVTKKSDLTDSDNGRYGQTKVERDRYRFKTPTLRNVALTWPYYHDGSVKSLNEAVEMMGKYQVGVDLTKSEIKGITTFLNTLTGKYKGKTLTNTNKIGH